MTADDLERRAERLRTLANAFYHEANIWRKSLAAILWADRRAYIAAMNQAAIALTEAERLMRRALRQYLPREKQRELEEEKPPSARPRCHQMSQRETFAHSFYWGSRQGQTTKLRR